MGGAAPGSYVAGEDTERRLVQEALRRGYLTRAALREALLIQEALRAEGQAAPLLAVLRARFLAPDHVETLTRFHRETRSAGAGLPDPASISPEALARSAELLRRLPEEDPAAVRDILASSGEPTLLGPRERRATRRHDALVTLPHARPPRGGDTTKPHADVLEPPEAGGARSSRGPDGRPRRIGPYEVLGEVARGGMGVVYRARDPDLEREVAVKVLLVEDEEEVERFRIEGRAAARLQHPNVVAVQRVGDDGGRPYLVMDLVTGASLQGRLQSEGPLPPEEVARVGEAVARALAYAHGRGILHRDLKPHNVLLTPEGEPRLTDFGLAKLLDGAATQGLTVTGEVMGTPSYMAPEQAAGDLQRVDRRTDVYGLGATLYALLVGRPPFEGTHVINVLSAVLEEAPVPPSRRREEVDGDLETIVLTCLEKEPGSRYDTAEELAEDLARWRRGEPVRARRPGRGERALRWGRRHRRLVVGLGVGFALVGAGVVASWVLGRERAARELRDQALAKVAAAKEAPGPTQRLRASLSALFAARAWHQASRSEAARRAWSEAACELARASMAVGNVALSEVALMEAASAGAPLDARRELGADLDRFKEGLGYLERANLAMGADPDAAVEYARAATELAPGLAMGWRQLARAQQNLERWAEAEEALSRAVALAPTTPDFRMAAVRLRRGARGPEAALDELDRQAPALDPRAVAWLRSDLLLEMGRVLEAREALTPLLARPGELNLLPEQLVEFARRLTYVGALAEAEAVLEEALARRPTSWFGRLLEAELRLAKGAPEACADAAEALIQERPTEASGWVLRAKSRLATGDVEDARADLERAAGLGSATLRELDEMGDLWLVLGEPEEAVRALTEMVRRLPREPAGYAFRAEAYRQAGRFEEALRDADRAVALGDAGWSASYTRGLTLIKLGRYSEALADLEDFLERASDHEHAATVRSEVLPELRRRLAAGSGR